MSLFVVAAIVCFILAILSLLLKPRTIDQLSSELRRAKPHDRLRELVILSLRNSITLKKIAVLCCESPATETDRQTNFDTAEYCKELANTIQLEALKCLILLALGRFTQQQTNRRALRLMNLYKALKEQTERTCQTRRPSDFPVLMNCLRA